MQFARPWTTPSRARGENLGHFLPKVFMKIGKIGLIEFRPSPVDSVVLATRAIAANRAKVLAPRQRVIRGIRRARVFALSTWRRAQNPAINCKTWVTDLHKRWSQLWVSRIKWRLFFSSSFSRLLCTFLYVCYSLCGVIKTETSEQLWHWVFGECDFEMQFWKSSVCSSTFI